MSFKGGEQVGIILGASKVVVVSGFESHTRGHSVRIKFEGGNEMLVYEDEILLADDPQLDRISKVHQSLLAKGYPHIALIKKTNDPKIYHKALKSTQELFIIKRIYEEKSTDKIKYTVFMAM